MRLTDNTQLRSISYGKYIAVFEMEDTARVSRAAEILAITHDRVFTCGWLIEDGYTEDGDRVVRECGARAVEFINGFACLAGHDHRNDCEYYTEEEAQGTINAGYMLASNARII